MADGFIEKIIVLDEWQSGSESFRLINKGAGPVELQILKDGEWVAESTCYTWGVITHRLLELKENKSW